MKLLVVGGAGHVGSIIRPALEQSFECTHFDLRPVEGSARPLVQGDLNSEEHVAKAIAGMDAVLYLAMGTIKNDRKTVGNIDVAFDVNVRGWYRMLQHGLKAGVKRFCYASTLSVYSGKRGLVNESHPPTAWEPYGMSKRVGEFLAQAAAQHTPTASILVLRLCLPQSEADWPEMRYDPARTHNHCATGPNDLRRLFVAAVNFDKPGCHTVQATGDLEGKKYPNDAVRALLGWFPNNE